MRNRPLHWPNGDAEDNMKNSNGKKARKTKNAESPPTWRWPLNAYRDKQRLVFESQTELEKAIDLLWTDDLRALPHAWPDGRSLVIPAEAVDYFTRAGLRFSAEKLIS